MICPHCNNQLPDESAFCLHCGKPVGPKAEPTPGPSANGGLAQAPAAGNPGPADQHAAPGGPAPGVPGAPSASFGESSSDQAQHSAAAQGLVCPHCGSANVKQIEGGQPTLMSFVWLPAVVALFASFFMGMIVALFIVIVGYAVFFAMYMHGGNNLLGNKEKTHYRCSLCDHVFTR